MHSFYCLTTHQLLPNYEAGRNLEQSLQCHSLVTTTAAKFQEDDHHCQHRELPTLLISLWKWRREVGVHIVTLAKLLSILTGNVTTVISISAIPVICTQTASSNIINKLCNLSILSVFSYLCIQLCTYVICTSYTLSSYPPTSNLTNIYFQHFSYYNSQKGEWNLG